MKKGVMTIIICVLTIGIVLATTWFEKEVKCFVCNKDNKFQRILIFILFAFSTILTQAQQFSNQSQLTLTDVYDGSIDWGDYDNDGDLDILITGRHYDSGTSYVSEVHRNDGDSIFSKLTSISLAGVYRGDALWGDYDNDGYLDIVLTGRNEISYTQYTKLYKNNGDCTFTEQTGITLPDMISGALDWGDYDNDGDLDLILSGSSYQGGHITKIFKNDGNNSFSELTGTNFLGLVWGSVKWGDYDNDGDLDILLTGQYQPNLTLLPNSKVYRNEGNDVFSEQTGIQLTGVTASEASWGDIDNDGDLDILLTGNALGTVGATTEVYLNNGNNSFSNLPNTGLIDAKNSSCDWGDYNNDGYSDVIISGKDANNVFFTKIFTNNGNNSFTELISDTLIGVYDGYTKWGDYDNDGDLDVLMTGKRIYGKITTIYRNDSATTNTKPSPPTGLSSFVYSDKILFQWSPSNDISTPQQALTYNICVGDSINAININAPQSLLDSGFHQVARFGEIRDTSYSLRGLSNLTFGDTIYWRVQSIDNAKEASAFSSNDYAIAPLIIEAIGDTTKNTNDTVAISVHHNSNLPTSYFWSPTNSLSNNSVQSPLAFPTKTTTYYVTVTSGTSVKTDSVTVNITSFEDAFATGISSFNAYYVAIGDYDNDNDLDLLLGGTSQSVLQTIIYKNNGNHSFTAQSSISLPAFDFGHMDWFDFNNDGNLDILITGKTGTNGNTAICKIYKNNGNNTFTEKLNHGLPANYYGSFDGGDYDNDGDLDLVMKGKDVAYNKFTRVYRNNGNFSFSLQNIALSYAYGGEVQWGDYDNDGDLDILYAGNSTPRIYRNDGNNIFSDQTPSSFPNLASGIVNWGDYDNDGYLDVFLMGHNPGYHAKIYKNNGNNTFTEQTSIQLSWAQNGEWGDYNNDGLLDLIINGASNGNGALYQNLGNNSFKVVDDFVLPNSSFHYGHIWGDFDNDNDLDFYISNNTGGKVFTNNSFINNSAPVTPAGLNSYSIGNQLYFKWNKAVDTITPSTALAYYINIGTSISGCEIKRAPSDLITGFTKKPMIARVQDTSFTFKIPASLQNTTLYWSVQTVDNGFVGSAFSPTDSVKYYSTSANLKYVVQPKSCEGEKSISMKMFNYGLNSIDSALIGWKVNGTPQPDYNWQGNLGVGDSMIIIIESNFLVNGIISYNFEAFVKLINGSSNFSLVKDTVCLSNQTFYPNPSVDLGPDTTCCWNHQVVLDAGAGYHYLWNTGDTTQTILLDSNLFSLGINQYYVTIHDSLNCFNSDSIDLILDPCTGILTHQLNREIIRVLPNPNNGNFNVVLEQLKNTEYSIGIFNLTGERIYHETIKPHDHNSLMVNIDISSCAKGFYILKLQSIEGIKVQSLIVE